MSEMSIKSRCEECGKYILIHNKIMPCQKCKRIVHAECSKNCFEFDHTFGVWQCWECVSNSPQQYNPFAGLSYNKHNPNYLENVDDIIEMNKILEQCSEYETAEFNNLSKSLFEEQSSKNFISVLFNNLDGNASNFDNFVTEINQLKTKFSVIGIAETNINECHKDLYKIPNYNSEFTDKFPGKRKGSGLGIYLHESISFSCIENLCKCSENLESLFVRVTNTDPDVVIGLVYRPPNGSLKHFLEELDVLMGSLPDKNVILMGDFNINLLQCNTDSTKFESVIYGNNFIPTISLATHEQPGCNPTLIDNILLNSTDMLISSGIINDKISHHAPIFCFLQCNLRKPERVLRTPKYDYCESNINSFISDIDETITNSKILYSNEDFDTFVNDIKSKIEENFKIDESQYGKSRRNRLVNPWITSGIIASVSTKNYYYKTWKKTTNKKNKLGDEALYLRYKNFRKKLKIDITHAKRNFYSKKFDRVIGNNKKVWELINELRGKGKSKINSCFIIDGKIVEDKREISNKFNIFFSSIARKLNCKLHSSTLTLLNHEESGNFNVTDKYPKYLHNRVMNSIYLSACTSDEIEKIIKDFENDKASDISITLLKKCAKFLSGHLSGFFNYFMDKGVFPGILKVGKITPIFKKGDPQMLDNYRPISLLPVFGKIFERVIYNRLYNFLTATKTLYDKQFGFRKNHSTEHAVNYSVNKILSELEDKNHVIGIFIDLSKAFDTIDHKKLLVKLDHYGIRGECLNLIKSYLSERVQFTDFKNTLSDNIFVEYGVPQGSVLGPLLFIIYINDIINCSTQGDFVLFADDTNIFITGNDEHEAYTNANIVLQEVYNYMTENQLHINLTKSAYMYFRPHLNKDERQTCSRTRAFGEEPTLKIADHKLKKVDKIKFLGVIIDDKLNWGAHIDNLANVLNSSLIMIKRIKKFIPESEYTKIYNSLFKPHISYCISCWGGIPSYRTEKIFSIQKRCIRLLFGNEINFDHAEYYETCARTRTYAEHMAKKDYCLEHTKPLFCEQKLLNLHNLYVLHTFMLLFKTIKFHEPISIFNLLMLSNRDNSLLLRLPLLRLDVSQQNFVYRASLLWNGLIDKLLNKCELNEKGIIVPGSSVNSDMCTSKDIVRRRLKDLLLDRQFDGDQVNWTPSNFYEF